MNNPLHLRISALPGIKCRSKKRMRSSGWVWLDGRISS
jgi:hypothetical protein